MAGLNTSRTSPDFTSARTVFLGNLTGSAPGDLFLILDIFGIFDTIMIFLQCLLLFLSFNIAHFLTVKHSFLIHQCNLKNESQKLIDQGHDNFDIGTIVQWRILLSNYIADLAYTRRVENQT